MAFSSLSENFQSFGRSSVWYCICFNHSGGQEILRISSYSLGFSSVSSPMLLIVRVFLGRILIDGCDGGFAGGFVVIAPLWLIGSVGGAGNASCVLRGSERTGLGTLKLLLSLLLLYPPFIELF